MNRLTDNGWCCGWFCGGFGACDDDTCEAHMAWARLRAYEDSGLTPEMCESIGRALAKGRGTAVIAANRATAYEIATCLLERPNPPIEVIVTLGPEEDANAAPNV